MAAGRMESEEGDGLPGAHHHIGQSPLQGILGDWLGGIHNDQNLLVHKSLTMGPRVRLRR